MISKAAINGAPKTKIDALANNDTMKYSNAWIAFVHVTTRTVARTATSGYIKQD